MIKKILSFDRSKKSEIIDKCNDCDNLIIKKDLVSFSMWCDNSSKNNPAYIKTIAINNFFIIPIQTLFKMSEMFCKIPKWCELPDAPVPLTYGHSVLPVHYYNHYNNYNNHDRFDGYIKIEKEEDIICPFGYNFEVDSACDEGCDLWERCRINYNRVNKIDQKNIEETENKEKKRSKRNMQDKSGLMTICSGPKENEEYCDCILYDESNILPCLHLRIDGDFCTALKKIEPNIITNNLCFYCHRRLSKTTWNPRQGNNFPVCLSCNIKLINLIGYEKERIILKIKRENNLL